MKQRIARCMVIFLLGVDVVMSQELQLGPPQDRAFTAELDATTQHYVLMLPEPWDPGGEHHLLIALHGHGSDRWQYIRQERGECRGARDMAARHGMIFVSPDYRGNSWMGPAAEADLVQIIEDLRAEFTIGKVFLAGGSMGGTSVLSFTALHPDLIAGVSAQNPVANLIGYAGYAPGVKAIEERYGGTAAEVPLEYKRRSAEYWPEVFTMPVAMTTGGRDTVVPPESALRLAKVLEVLQRQVLVIHRPETGHETNYEDTCAALEFVLETALGAGGD
ncbi:MAG: prolyl oligopeptidase family serine peptidase [candidate division WS1 bacterium]|nr:prolyl oligopeptidase family serine peptidase [candidate division WS1 bacterium]